MSDQPTVHVREDADGRWDWEVRHGDAVVAQCLKQIGCDERPRSRKRAVKRARRVAAGWQRQREARWETVLGEETT